LQQVRGDSGGRKQTTSFPENDILA